VKFILLPDTDLLESHCDNNKWSPGGAKDVAAGL
jgi:hypothetical protein